MKSYYTIALGVLMMAKLLPAADKHPSLQPFFEKHCTQCHGEKKQKGKIRLDKISGLDASKWQTIYEQLANREMPPDDEPQPTDAERKKLANRVLAMAAEATPVMATGFRRLNKREYGNTVRVLLGLQNGIFDPSETIYEDEVSEGFDTEAEELVISNELLLEYLGAAEKSLRLALFSPDAEKPESRITNVKTQKMKGGSKRYVSFGPDHIILRVGGKSMVYDGEDTRTMSAPGRYTITVTATGVDRDRFPVKFQPENGPLKLGVGVIAEGEEGLSSIGKLHKIFDLKDNKEQTFKFDLWIDKDHYPYISFANGASKPITQIRSNVRRRKLPASAMKEPFMGPGVQVSKYRIEGPFNDEWPPKSFQATYDSEKIPDLKDPEARKQLIQRFASRAFRRSVDSEELSPYFTYITKQHADTKDWHESLIRTFAAIMASVDFLYIREDPGELDSYALANRLSYFLWSTMPDAALLAAAKSGEIRKPEVLRAHVSRLLEDPRSDNFCNSFADQWLSLDTLGTMPPDVKDPKYRVYFRKNLEQAMVGETHRYFRHILRENISVRDFIDSDYSFINSGLAELYGVDFKGGDQLAKFTFPPEAKRGGLLGHGSILTLTSNGVETSPVVRGHWVLDELLGTPPPPAPKEVPALVPDLNGVTTVRDQLEKHRSDAACMECHRRMDPPGFALEAFDPIGRLRTTYSPKQKITTDGKFLGKEFQDIEEFKEILLGQIRPFARNLIVKISEYAKGRKLHFSDLQTVEKILDRTSANNYRLKDMMVEIATSSLMTQR